MAVQIISVPNFGNFKKVWDSRRSKFYKEAMDMIVGDIVVGIDNNKDMATGSKFPELCPITIAKKGHRRPLINKGFLRSEGTYEQLNKFQNDTGEIRVKPIISYEVQKDGTSIPSKTRTEIATILQIDGVDCHIYGHRRFLFYGISKDAEKEILKLVGDIVIDSLEAL